MTKTTLIKKIKHLIETCLKFQIFSPMVGSMVTNKHSAGDEAEISTHRSTGSRKERHWFGLSKPQAHLSDTLVQQDHYF